MTIGVINHTGAHHLYQNIRDIREGHDGLLILSDHAGVMGLINPSDIKTWEFHPGSIGRLCRICIAPVHTGICAPAMAATVGA